VNRSNLRQSAGFSRFAGKACASRQQRAICSFCNAGDLRNRVLFAVRGRSARQARVE
jgi:hypothetical protein